MNYARMSGPGDSWFQEPGWREDHFEIDGYRQRLLASPSFNEWAMYESPDVDPYDVATQEIQRVRNENRRHPLGGPMTEHEKCEHLCAGYERDDYYPRQERMAA